MNNLRINAALRAESAKQFAHKHKTKIAVAATAAAGIALNVRTASAYNDFLKEKGLYDEFFEMDEV